MGNSQICEIRKMQQNDTKLKTKYIEMMALQNLRARSSIFRSAISFYLPFQIFPVIRLVQNRNSLAFCSIYILFPQVSRCRYMTSYIYFEVTSYIFDRIQIRAFWWPTLLIRIIVSVAFLQQKIEKLQNS